MEIHCTKEERALFLPSKKLVLVLFVMLEVRPKQPFAGVHKCLALLFVPVLLCEFWHLDGGLLGFLFLGACVFVLTIDGSYLVVGVVLFILFLNMGSI